MTWFRSVSEIQAAIFNTWPPGRRRVHRLVLRRLEQFLSYRALRPGWRCRRVSSLYLLNSPSSIYRLQIAAFLFFWGLKIKAINLALWFFCQRRFCQLQLCVMFECPIWSSTLDFVARSDEQISTWQIFVTERQAQDKNFPNNLIFSPKNMLGHRFFGYKMIGNFINFFRPFLT